MFKTYIFVIQPICELGRHGMFSMKRYVHTQTMFVEVDCSACVPQSQVPQLQYM